MYHVPFLVRANVMHLSMSFVTSFSMFLLSTRITDNIDKEVLPKMCVMTTACIYFPIFQLISFLTQPYSQWDADGYQSQHSFVWTLGSSLIDLLDPQPNEHVLDLGCGTGELSQAIAERGAVVTGIDLDPQMIAKAQTNFPSVTFSVADARTFQLPSQVDAVFSNAMLHWVPESERAVASIAKALKPSGRFVAEFGGTSNVKVIAEYLDNATSLTRNPWYFPSISQYSSLLARYGFEVTFAQLYDRPTPLSQGEDGLRNWILMFGGSYLEGLSEAEKEDVMRGAEETLKSTLHDGEQWVADYRRIRIEAKLVADAYKEISEGVCDSL